MLKTEAEAAVHLARWDKWNALGGPKYPHEKVVQFVFRNYPPEVRSRINVLDLGCGNGVHTHFLASEGFVTSGVDISPVGVERTRAKLQKDHLSARLSVASIDATGFAEASFDLIISVGVMDSAGPEVTKRAALHIASILKPGGRGFFLFASERDFRVAGDNPYRLHGYSEREVRGIFLETLFSKAWVDRYITTYENGKIEENDFLVTVQK